MKNIGPALAILILVIAYPFIWLYEQLGGVLFALVVFGIPLAVWYFKNGSQQRHGEEKRSIMETAEEREARKKREAEEFHAKNIQIIRQRQEAELHKRVHVVETEAGDLAVDWRRQFDEINKAWREGDYDFARTWLQKLAYSLTSENASTEVHDRFKALMVAFTRDDPMYANVMREALPSIGANPGIVQSILSKQFPQFDAEQFRYALYYGEIIGDVVRKKKGRSYALYLPNIESDAEQFAQLAERKEPGVSVASVDARQAAEWLYELFQQNTWLLDTKPVRHADADIEHQAVAFILAVAEQGVSDWGKTSQKVKETISLLMMDFLAKLMHPQSPFATRQWEVSVAGSHFQKILEIIAYEIRCSHSQFAVWT